MKALERVKSLFVSDKEALHRYVARTLGNVDDAEEVVQDTFHNYIKLQNTESIENPKAYLFKTAHNLALNRIRTANYKKAYEEGLRPVEHSPSLEREFIAQRDVELLVQSLYELPKLTQDIFIMSRVDHLTYTEIGQQTGLSNSGVKKHIIKTLSFLRDKLGDLESGRGEL